jgi:hypothetical protein
MKDAWENFRSSEEESEKTGNSFFNSIRSTPSVSLACRLTRIDTLKGIWIYLLHKPKTSYILKRRE